MVRYRVGLDIGGTFTDIVIEDSATGEIRIHKVLTDAFNPSKSFINGLLNSGTPIEEIKIIIHATTLGTNMFLGQMNIKPPKAVLITNKGFIDIIEIGRQNRPSLYNLFFRRPRPLIPRNMRVGISGRIDASGRELEPIDEDEIRGIARRFCGEAEVFIVSLLHSYVNNSHEDRVREIIEEECPDALVVLSHEVDPRPKEYERTSTTVINGMLRPILSKYLGELMNRLREMGYRGAILVMRSSGGISNIEYALRHPASFIESGPAAGAVAVAYYSKLMNIKYALGLDMGGTTAKASAIIDGEPLVTSEYEVGGEVHMGRVVRGSGYPLRIPHIDLAEVSSGGGTIAWVDEGGMLRVGPMSAGADPGPVCYGRGGIEPTVTDAHLILGRLPDTLGGGAVVLDRGAALDAMKRLADKLGIDVFEAASRIIDLANQHMGRAVRLVTVERGLDPNIFTLFAFGGAGPLHAADLMDLGFREAVIPNHAGVFSALGLLYTDYKYDFIRGISRYDDEVGQEYIDGVFEGLVDEALRRVEADGLGLDGIKIFKYLEMRYWGQAYELTVPYSGSIKEALENFHELHMARYGYMMGDERIFIESARLELYKYVDKPTLKLVECELYRPKPVARKDVYYGESGWIPTNIYIWDELKPGGVIDGPALIMMETSTVLVPEGYSAEIDSIKSIHLRRLGE